MAIREDEKFAFEVQGYLHLRGALRSEEVQEYLAWSEHVEKTDVQALNADRKEEIPQQLNRPLSRMIDADVRFARFLDHPVAEPYLSEFLGSDYRHIDNDLYYTFPGYKGGAWHCGVPARPDGFVREGRFVCPMVKVFFCISDVGPDEGGFVVVPGSHKRPFEIDMK